MQSPRNSSVQNIFLYREVTNYCRLIRSDSKTLYYLILPHLYTTFCSRKYFNIPFSFFIVFSSEKAQVLGLAFAYNLKITKKREEREGKREEGEKERNYSKHKY